MRHFHRHLRPHQARKKLKGVFGGQIKSQAEIEQLNLKIKAQEAAELAAFEKTMDEQLKQL